MLFIMVMSMIMREAVDKLSDSAKEAYKRRDLADVVYADDTLLLGVSREHLQEFLQAVASAGQSYGMELHWGKFQPLPVQSRPNLRTPIGEPIPTKQRMDYLGTVISADVHDHHELVKRIAMAKADFLALENVWRRSALTQKRKVHIFQTLIESKLLYSLSTMCLTVAQERKSKGFQNRCIRSIIGVKPSYFSRVSNEDVLTMAAHRRATAILQQRQLQLFGRILRSPEGHPLRLASFIPGTSWPVTEQYVRRRGGPAEWVSYMRQTAIRVFGGMSQAEAVAPNKPEWNRIVSLQRS